MPPAPIDTVLERLRAEYPEPTYELQYVNPLQLLVAAILAAQCTDARVNAVTPTLFKKYPDAAALAAADQAELETILRSISMYRIKAKAIRESCQIIRDEHGGEVPTDIDELIKLPRVARKTANLVLTLAHRIPSGIVVDTHVARVSERLGLTTQTKGEKIEADLLAAVPESEWVDFGPRMTLLGRTVCTSAKPACDTCVMNDLCPRIGLTTATTAPKEAKTERATPKATPAPATMDLPESWREVLSAEWEKPYFQELQAFVAEERTHHSVFPPAEDVFTAFKLAPFDSVKVLLLGQDPYHDDGQAHGLCFSVRPGVSKPPSLRNMFKELADDLGCTVPNHGYLTGWAEQGILMLNAVLTVRAHEPASHAGKGWETFTDAVIRALSDREKPLVFVLWGGYAKKKEKLIDKRHAIVKMGHPSPLSQKYFLGSRPYSQINAKLRELGHAEINWQLADLSPESGTK